MPNLWIVHIFADQNLVNIRRQSHCHHCPDMDSLGQLTLQKWIETTAAIVTSSGNYERTLHVYHWVDVTIVINQTFPLVIERFPSCLSTCVGEVLLRLFFFFLTIFCSNIHRIAIPLIHTTRIPQHAEWDGAVQDFRLSLNQLGRGTKTAML